MPPTPLTPQVIARQALEKLRAQADPEKARQVQKYFRETVRSFGVTSPAVRAIAAELHLAIKKEWSIAQVLHLCAILFPRPELEAKGSPRLSWPAIKKNSRPSFSAR